jgi:uncharacterized protein YjbI with pentapeptide repeats
MFYQSLSDIDLFEVNFQNRLRRMEDGLERFDFKELYIEEENFEGGYFVSIDFTLSTFIKCIFNKPSIVDNYLHGVKFSQCSFAEGGFVDCNISRCNFDNVVFRDHGFWLDKIVNTSFRDVEFEKIDLSRVDLSTCQFERIKGNEVRLHGTKLPASERSMDWWKFTDEDKIIWV